MTEFAPDSPEAPLIFDFDESSASVVWPPKGDRYAVQMRELNGERVCGVGCRTKTLLRTLLSVPVFLFLTL